MPRGHPPVTAPTEKADLLFQQTHRPSGFTNAELAHFDGSAEPVIRELLQNSLDAAIAADRPAEITFVIQDVDYSAVPGLDTFREAFISAKAERQRWHGGNPSPDEETIVERIEGALHLNKIPVLLCIDNGHGLNGERMDALLVPGNTKKGAGGAGSFGVGHYAAFAASNLRYVLYAAKYRDSTLQAPLSTIMSGHAILASHRNGNKHCAADGYWFKAGQVAFNFDHNSYYPQAPVGVLKDGLTQIPDTGTIVCITGFNSFHRGEGDPECIQLIGEVAAANFSVAIHSRKMTIKVIDESRGHEANIDADNLGVMLERLALQQRARARGQLRGAFAHGAWKVLEDGFTIDSIPGTELKWRPLADESTLRSPRRVHVFRKGMWITSSAPGLLGSDFGKRNPFEAVLMLNEGELEELVRRAEGPEHRGINKNRLNRTRQRRLRQLLHEVAELIRASVGVVTETDEYIPPGFAEFRHGEVRSAEPAPRRRTLSFGSREASGERGKKKVKAQRRRSRRTGTPRRGSASRFRMLPLSERSPRTLTTEIAIEDETNPTGDIGIRVRQLSGSDATCDYPLPHDWLRLSRVWDDAGNVDKANSRKGELELVLPARPAERKITILAAEVVGDVRRLELDVVNRRLMVDS